MSRATMRAPAVQQLRALPVRRDRFTSLVTLVAPLAVVLVAAEAVYELAGAHGFDTLFEEVVHDAALLAATLLCLARAVDDTRWRPVALAFGLGLATWTLGDVVWGILYTNDPSPPYPSPADPLWLLWYPFTALGMALLIRLQIKSFRLHRWLDGLAVMLIVLTPLAALLLEPAAQEAGSTTGAEIVNFSYPVLDTLLIGAVVGVYGVTAWRPGRTWLLLGIGCILMALGDGLFAVQEARDASVSARYDFIWPLGALLIAWAIWRPSAAPAFDSEVVGWRAIILALAAQALAIGIQLYSLLIHELGEVERIITIVVLLVAMAQIVISRPRADDAPA